MEVNEPAWAASWVDIGRLVCRSNTDGCDNIDVGALLLFILLLLRFALRLVNLKTLSDVKVSTLVVEETEIALSTEVERLCIVARILQHSRQGHDGMQEELLANLAQGNIGVALQHELIGIRAVLKGQNILAA